MLTFFAQLQGKVAVPLEAASLMKALKDAETGRAQRLKGLENEFEESFPEIPLDIELAEGEVLRLPPTPGQTIREEEEEDLQWQLKEKKRLLNAELYDVKIDPTVETTEEREWREGREREEADREEAEREIRVRLFTSRLLCVAIDMYLRRLHTWRLRRTDKTSSTRSAPRRRRLTRGRESLL